MEKMPQARRSGLIIQEVDGEILIYDQNSNKAHCLNQTAAKVWKYCDGETTLADACSALSRDLETPVDEKLVWYAVDQFSKDQLLEKGYRAASLYCCRHEPTADGSHSRPGCCCGRAAGDFHRRSHAGTGRDLPPTDIRMRYASELL